MASTDHALLLKIKRSPASNTAQLVPPTSNTVELAPQTSLSQVIQSATRHLEWLLSERWLQTLADVLINTKGMPNSAIVEIVRRLYQQHCQLAQLARRQLVILLFQHGLYRPPLRVVPLQHISSLQQYQLSRTPLRVVPLQYLTTNTGKHSLGINDESETGIKKRQCILDPSERNIV